MGTSIDRLTPLDRLMVGASRRWPQDIGALAVMDGTSLLDPAGELRIDAVREAIESRLHLVPRFRQKLRFEPRITLEPASVSPRRMRQRKHLGRKPQALPPVPDGGIDRSFVQISHMPGHGVRTEANHQLNLRQQVQDLPAPCRCAFPPRRQIRSPGIQTWKTQAHGHDGKCRRITKLIRVHLQPLPQTVARS